MKIYQCLKYLEVWSQLQIRGLDLQNSKILSKLSKLVKHIKFLLNTLLNIVNFALFKMNIRRELIYHIFQTICDPKCLFNSRGTNLFKIYKCNLHVYLLIKD